MSTNVKKENKKHPAADGKKNQKWLWWIAIHFDDGNRLLFLFYFEEKCRERHSLDNELDSLFLSLILFIYMGNRGQQ